MSSEEKTQDKAPEKTPEQAAEQLREEAQRRFREAEERRIKRIMDPKSRYHLAGMLPFGPDEHSDFTPVAFRNLPNPPVFHLKAYSAEALSDFRKATSNPETANINAEIVKLLKIGLVGWERLITRGGKELPFSVENIALLPEALIHELDAECTAYANGILPEEAEALG